jgi:hypothetical protein
MMATRFRQHQHPKLWPGNSGRLVGLDRPGRLGPGGANGQRQYAPEHSSDSGWNHFISLSPDKWPERIARSFYAAAFFT